MQYSYAKNIENSRKEHNIVGPNCNSPYHNKELEVGRINTSYGWLSVHCGRSGRARKLVPPSVFDPWTTQPPEGRHTGYATPAAIFTFFKIVYNLCSTEFQIYIIQQSLLSNLWSIRAADSVERLYIRF
jgi:hypothetical protein